MSGVGPLEIPLEEGYRAKDWTIQLRWPHEMVDVQCFSDKVTTMDCGGAGEYFNRKIWLRNLNENLGCLFPESHHHITPHFWDANVGTLGVQLMPKWPMAYAEIWPELSGPIPCIDWCDDGKKPEYPGPCTTQPPTTTTTPAPSTTTPKPTTTTTTTTTTTKAPSCSDICYDAYFACLDGCESDDSVCQSECGRTHFNCINNCE